MTKELQFLATQQNGIVVNFVLPIGWELVEQGIDAKTGKIKEDLNVYSLISRAPVAKKGDPTDLIFELDIYKHGLTENLPSDLPADKRDPGVLLWDFLNAQISANVKHGLKCATQAKDIAAKAYGPPSREQTMYVPIHYNVPAPPKSGGAGSVLYTFTSMVGDKVYVLKFLVAKDQVDNYGALIALILHNSFGMTQADYDKAVAAMKAAQNNTGKGSSK